MRVFNPHFTFNIYFFTTSGFISKREDINCFVYSPVIISGYERLPAAQIAGSAWSVKTGLELEPYGYHTRICPAKTAGQ